MDTECTIWKYRRGTIYYTYGNKIYDLISHRRTVTYRYPEQMQKFTKIFAVLAQAEINDELEIALKMVTRMLGLDYEMVKVYFDQHKTARRPEFMRGEFAPPNIIAGIEKAVEAIKSKSKAVKVYIFKMKLK